MIQPRDFKKIDAVEYWKISPYKIPVHYFEEQGHDRSFALVEATLSGDRGNIRIQLHPDVQFTVYEKQVHYKLHPMDLSSTFKCMIEYMRVVWVTEATYRKYMEQFKNPHLKPGEGFQKRESRFI